ncbi:MAG: hypothetical protein AAGD92_10185 [Pseudomonadota bacterium]
MNYVRHILLGSALAAVMTGAASSQSLKEARARDTYERALMQEARYTQSVCKNDFAVDIDWRSAESWSDGSDLVDACDRALGGIEAECRSGNARALSLKKMVCAGDGAGASVSSGTLRYGAAPGMDGFYETRKLLTPS